MNRVLKVMKVMNGVGAIGAVSGLVTGWTYCDVSESPMLNEKAGSAIMLAFSLFGGAVASPIIIPFSLLKKYENRMRGKDIDALEYYKYQMEIATGSWRHRSPLNEKIINKPR